MTQSNRLTQGGRIDREQSLSFVFNGQRYTGNPGDTLASALLANDQHLIGRSFKYHRPRGIIGHGAEDPNAIVQMGEGARTIPNVRATQAELFDGLTASSVNCWPSVDVDLLSINQWFGRLLPAGFYYKTFKWPASAWDFYERRIRASAGLGVIPSEPDPDHYVHQQHHVEVLVIGAGAAGLAAALAACRAGAQVLLVDDQAELGGGLLAMSAETMIGEDSAEQWRRETIAELQASEKVQLLTRATAIGFYDHGFVTLAERLTDHLPVAQRAGARERLWKVRAQQVVLAQGAFERPLVYGNNDLPGTLLASSVQTYIERYAVIPGGRGVLFTNNDQAYTAALSMLSAGIALTIVDSRATASHPLIDRAMAAGAEVLKGFVVSQVEGGHRVKRAIIYRLVEDGRLLVHDRQYREVDFIALSGGQNPAVHLHSQASGQNTWDEQSLCFVPSRSRQAAISVGAGNGTFDLMASIREGFAGGLSAVQAIRPKATATLQLAEMAATPLQIEALWCVPQPRSVARAKKAFVDYQNDTTAADIQLAVREGYHSVEHVKRYTALGFGTDQGKLGNINGMAILAEALGQSIPETGTTTFRPLYTPTSMGLFAGRNVDALFDPVRRTPIQSWHEANGALWENVGQWKRPLYYPNYGDNAVGKETFQAAIDRENLAIHNGIAVLDASTLGKIDIQGKDAAEFLNRVYINGWKTLKIGACRYGLMLNDRGFIMDDGVTTRLSEQHFLMTTTSGNAAAVMTHLECWLQTEWPELSVYLTSVTDQWGTISVNGPHSRDVMEALCDDVDFAESAFPFMTYQEGTVAGVACRVMRISFSGELTYEINAPAHLAQHVWDAVFGVGEQYGVTPYGTETMHVARAERGFLIVGQETDGSVTAQDAGYGRMFSSKKEFIGKRSAQRSYLQTTDRNQLVGLKPVDNQTVVMEGAHILTNTSDHEQVNQLPVEIPVSMDGHVTSSYWSAFLGHPIALAMIKGGHDRHGEVVMVSDHVGNTTAMTIGSPNFVEDWER